MIRKHITVKKAFCDACGETLSSEDQKNDNGTPSAVHYGKLEGHFGFGSNLDYDPGYSPPRQLELCEKCYLTARRALMIPTHASDIPEWLFVRTRPFLIESGEPYRGEVGKEIYHMPVWGCIFCTWEIGGRGYSLAQHRCEAVEKAEANAKEICPACKGDEPAHEVDPVYAERRDAWVHYPVPPARFEPIICAGNKTYLEAMRKEERVSSELLEKIEEGDQWLAQQRAERAKKDKPGV